MPARTKARKRALDVLFEADQRGQDPLATLAAWLHRQDPPVPAYAEALVRGVADHQPQIDDLLTRQVRDWSLDRLPAVDRAVLRLGLYELLWCDDVPDAVVIDEAVRLAKDLSTEDSAGYVNGVLAAVLAAKPTAR